jgi:hypothetical protein
MTVDFLPLCVTSTEAMSGVILTATSSAEKALAGISIAADIRDVAISLFTGFTLLVSSTVVSARYGPEALMI